MSRVPGLALWIQWWTRRSLWAFVIFLRIFSAVIYTFSLNLGHRYMSSQRHTQILSGDAFVSLSWDQPHRFTRDHFGSKCSKTPARTCFCLSTREQPSLFPFTFPDAFSFPFLWHILDKTDAEAYERKKKQKG